MLSKKKIKSIVIGVVAMLLIGAATTLLLWPHQVVDHSRLVNRIPLANHCAIATSMTNAEFWSKRLIGKTDWLAVSRPLTVDTAMRYPLIVVLTDSPDGLDKEIRYWGEHVDSAYVMVYAGRQNLFEGKLTDRLLKSGMLFDIEDLTLVDRTKKGDVGRKMMSDSLTLLKEIVMTGQPLEGVTSHRRVMLWAPDEAKKREYESVLPLFADADLRSGDLADAVEDLVSDRMPVAQTRLNSVIAEAHARGCDDKYYIFIDFRIPSGKFRFFLYDIEQQRFVISSKCAHGYGGGSTDTIPQFSNEHGSCATSLGTYHVEDVHRMFKNGRLAINVQGLDSTNFNANARGIKIHGGMRYGEIYPRYIELGMISEGCFALSDPNFSALMVAVATRPKHILLEAYQAGEK